MHEVPHRITVLGAGIAGLTAAIALARAGHRVTILERATEPDAGGAGIQISPNGMAVLRALGLEGQALAVGSVANEVEIRDSRRGNRLTTIDLSRYRERHCPYMLFRRADLVGALTAAARAAGVAIAYGCNVRRLTEDGGKIHCHLDAGEIRSAQFLVGADGLNSPTRSFLNAVEAPPISTHIAWRAVIDGNVPVQLKPGAVRLVVGRNRHLVIYWQRGRTALNLVAVCRIRRVAGHHPPVADNPELLARSFADFGGDVPELLGSIETASKWWLRNADVARRWHDQRAVIIGDALHPVLPFLAQGGNLALEDGWVLARQLTAGNGIDEALQAFRGIREARVKRVAVATRLQGWCYHFPPRPARQLLFSTLNAANLLAPGLATRSIDWIYNKDVTAGS